MQIGMLSPLMSVRAAKQALLLKKQGHHVSYLSASPIWNGFESYFDNYVQADTWSSWIAFAQQDFDILIYYNQPNEPAAELILRGAKLIFDCADMVSFYRGTVDPAEAYIFQNAVGIIHSSPGAKLFANRLFKIKCPQFVLPNYVSRDLYLKPKKEKRFSASIIYQGGFAPGSSGHRDYTLLFEEFTRRGFTLSVYPSPSSPKESILRLKKTKNSKLAYF
jgi:hypothetical protein